MRQWLQDNIVVIIFENNIMKIITLFSLYFQSSKINGNSENNNIVLLVFPIQVFENK